MLLPPSLLLSAVAVTTVATAAPTPDDRHTTVPQTVPASAHLDSTATGSPVTLSETTVRAKRRGLYRSFDNVENSQTLSLHELSRAACCNLGESFTTNPSVDVNYSDAATGARQIRLLGLAGTYVQMMTENIPNFRIAAQPFGLNYVPGPWMAGIQVSKGAASVKNGYEGITGQINVEYKKPHQAHPHRFAANGYADLRGRLEGNAESTILLSPKWSTTILGHYDKHLDAHDDNRDGFADMPRQEQLNLLNRWTYNGGKIFSQFGVSGLKETRSGGQIVTHAGHALPTNPYRIDIDTRRLEVFGKTAYMLGDSHNTNFAIVLNGTLHDQDAAFGHRRLDVQQTGGYGSLMFETQITHDHSFSAGVSLNHDGFTRTLPTTGIIRLHPEHNTDETVPGIYAQYTYEAHDLLTLMLGLRADHSNLFGTFVTPRAHLKFTPSRNIALRLSAGKGYRATHVLEENSGLLAGSRKLEIESDVLREEAWNYGASLTLRQPVAGRILNLTTEYYYTDFRKQAVMDFDSSPALIRFYQLDGRSYSSVFQIEASYPFFEGFNLTAAYRQVDVKTTYNLPTGRTRLEKPLQSRYKAILTATYSTPLERWQLDATLQLNGGGRLPKAYTNTDGIPSWSERYKAFPQLSAQITRNFRYWSIYIGGENLTGYRQDNAIIDAAHPWGNRFDPTMVYAPLDGAMAYVGFRYTLPR